jgi:ABC-type transport system involved in Fe-S cluster assembly fused permease/ATPase subunit
VVLDGGRIVAWGPHDRLVREDAGYRARWELDAPIAP